MIQQLPLAVVDGITAQPCVRSGFCCKQAACGFGTYDHEAKQCIHLQRGSDGRYECGIADTIVTDPTWQLSPAFGAGCCSTFNRDRQEILKRLREASPDVSSASQGAA